ncbi:MAG: tRNA (adenosine(37)-N6)-threonylcarbamoyltransferase complex ATPase subunit type 1 TsaE [Polyangia bacterium]|jgi:tRNA threonylcarbamoyladenosine biosynthesis protein TsaE
MTANLPTRSLSLVATSAADMQAIGARLGQVLAIGDVVALTGPLGAGKTTFVQGLARGLQVPAGRQITSPTFALVHQHPGRLPLAHIDFYRIKSPSELPELGLEEMCDEGATAIEWADRFPEWLPNDSLRVAIVMGGTDGRDQSRTITLESRGPRGRRLLAAAPGHPGP